MTYNYTCERFQNMTSRHPQEQQTKLCPFKTTLWGRLGSCSHVYSPVNLA